MLPWRMLIPVIVNNDIQIFHYFIKLLYELLIIRINLIVKGDEMKSEIQWKNMMVVITYKFFMLESMVK